jgi:group I intron endonuclease
MSSIASRVKIPGVYAIIHIASGKQYVGSSRDMDHRWAIHFWQLEKGTHWNAALQADYTRDGGAAFTHTILERCPDLTTLRTQEAAWIKYLHANETGYNLRQSKRITSTVAESKGAWAAVFGKQDAA